MKINNRIIENNKKPYVIAEIGINHNGDLALAKMMIDIAKECNCDAVKFQKRTIETVYTKEELEKERHSVFGNTNGDLKRGLEFSRDDYKELFRYAKEKEIDIFASPWDCESVDFLEEFDMPCYKVASASITDMKLLERIKETGKPVIISTGMSTEEEVEKAVNVFDSDKLSVLACTSTYPTMIDDMNLNKIETLMKKYPEIPIGYSGHEEGILPTLIAVSMGVAIVERHITVSKYIWGSDQKASLEPQELMNLTKGIDEVRRMMGSGNIDINESEKPVKTKLRRY